MIEFTGIMIYKASSGDQEAIAELYNLTYNSVYKTVKSMIADEDTVLDIVQDSFIKGFQNLDRLDAPHNFRAWMKRIATNTAKDYLRKKKPILFTDMANEDGEEIDFRDECLDHCPEELLDRKETTRLMQEILATLSDDQRIVIGMFYYEEMSVREIAEILSCSENTVKSRLNYGRKKIEAKVRELEKKGTKLYSLAPLPFLLWLFRMDADATETPSAAMLERITSQCVADSALWAAAPGIGTTAAVQAGAGAKALAVKIIAGVLAVTVAGGGTALALSAMNQRNAENTQQRVSAGADASGETSLPADTEAAAAETAASEATTETAAAVTPEDAYQGITAEYQAVLSVDSTAFMNRPESYFNGDHAVIRYHHMNLGSNFYYAYADIDGNGMEELLIAIGNDGYYRIVDLYGFDGEQAVQLIDEPTLGDRSSLSLLTDGTLYLFGASSATEASHTYMKLEGCIMKDAPASTAAERIDITWQPLEFPKAPTVEVSFDSILTDIQSALTVSVENYDSNMEYYNGQYRHLGEGVMWMLMYRQAGDYTMSIWNTSLDIDRDGHEELCIGRGVSPSSITPIVIYRANGVPILGDAIYAYTDLFYGGAPIQWDYLGG